jgi:hypothetical protein
MVDKNLIKERKAIYGSNFTCIKNKWEFLFQKVISEREVAEAMKLMKECRIEAIKQKINKTDNKAILKKLNKALKDSFLDKSNYEWIADNYEEYKNL